MRLKKTGSWGLIVSLKMKFLSGMAIMLLLNSCAGNMPASGKIEGVIAEADAAKKSGQIDKAARVLKAGTVAFPAEKAPWIRLAQMKFDSDNYVDAIAYALEGLQRDPKDKLANSIVAVSGLRLSTKALNDLRSQNDLNGSIRVEAQGLAKTLRESLGESVLIPQPPPRPKLMRPRKIITPGKPGSPGDSSSDGTPFGSLQ
ncbi:tetratricopeptide repeat protein [Herbaspirillum sp. RTI4]|uniref:tetratricopeptide repeat protein n=1 Tax=Herbaspirillum sp. RTI4 TaxID=3048640 RepID=UPI002AB3C2B8|nr:tetratricopeptide repeat protein [Herbaspirillum sp. RTI4]MDY7579032.1 tetratricopeptide repeat protein [Herbaspirillum sp. RTI4]MEA9983583.1 tetratricopeptide repeat protein [Herbaspirillum sp. RTI4]